MKQNNVKVFGNRVLVRKERIDAGGLNLTPAVEEDGKKNTGIIIAVGQVKLRDRFYGIREGAKVYFRKFFVANDGQEDSLVFVEVENITGISND